MPGISNSAPSEHIPFFSLIMPVYGVERYIADAIADVLCQTFGDFELIVVNDCTPDRSAEIATELAGGDPRVHLIAHTANSGVSEARNTGIQAARGTWLLFPDPDDRYDVRLLERIHNILSEDNPDLLVFGHTQEYFDPNGEFLYSNALNLNTQRAEDDASLARMALQLEKETHLGYPWNKAYRASVVHTYNLRFETVPYIEDILFNLEYLSHAASLQTTAANPYRYAKRLGENLTNAEDGRYFAVHRRRIEALCSFAKRKGCWDTGSRSLLGALYGRYILSAAERSFAATGKMSLHERRTWLNGVFADDLFGELVEGAQADSRLLRTCLAILKTRNALLVSELAHIIHMVRTTDTVSFTKARSKR